jgi:hypothetical protein
MATSSTSSAEVPGYYRDPLSGAWCTLPWPGDRDLPYSHPDRVALLPPSLGLQVIQWAESNLIHALTGKPWRFTNGQRRFLMLWYAVDVDAGRWVYRRGVKRGSKGTGKDHFLSAWMLCEALGPVRIADIDRGQPVGAPQLMPLVQVGANSEDQAKKVLRIVNAMLPGELIDEHGIDKGLTRTYVGPNGGMLECLTSSEASSEGDPPTAAGMNESHHMKANNGGHLMFGVVRRNIGKSPRDIQALLLEFTNGHEEGADSIAERSFKAWQAQVGGRAAGKRDILYDSVEALPGTDIYDEHQRRAGLQAAYFDAPWSDLERLEDEVLDPDLSVSEALRFYFNLIAENEESWIEPRKFDAMANPGLVVADGEAITMFLDCSKTSDATALMGCRLSDGHVFTIGVWKRPPGKRGESWMVPRDEVDTAVRDHFARFRVMWFGVDPSPATEDTSEANYWLPTIDKWHQDLGKKLLLWATPGARVSKGTGGGIGHSVKFDMRLSQPGAHERNRLFVGMAQQTQQDIDATTESQRAFTHDGDSTLVLHTHHARNHQTSWGVSLGKANRKSPNLVDAAVAMVGARLGRQIVLNSGKWSNRPKAKARAVVYR